MLSAIDSEMDRCFAELRVLNSQANTESTISARRNFKDVLRDVVKNYKVIIALHTNYKEITKSFKNYKVITKGLKNYKVVN